MTITQTTMRRRGSILPLVTLALIGLCGFIALAIDVGMLMAGRTQAQNAADVAAMTAARTLDGTTGGNVAQATTNGTNAVKANQILSKNLQASEVTFQFGAYHYDTGTQTFSPQFPPVAPDNYNLAQATVTHADTTTFARALGINVFTVSATAIAAHRPRDVAIVLDYSGSMNNESDLWNNESYLGSVNNSPNNTDPIFPQYGQYDPTFSPLCTLQCTSADPRVGKCNITQSVLGIPAMVNDFYQNNFGAGAVPAFLPAPAAVTNSTPGGDKFLPNPSTGQPAKHIQDALSATIYTKFPGYKALNGGVNFAGYSQGPGYYGMTFFAWPPDISTDSGGVTNDWRKRFFFLSDGVTPNNDNTNLPLSGSGNYPDPPGSYVVNYKAILAWITANCVQQSAGDGRPFPPQLRAGNILYYDQIPTDVPAASYNHSTNNNTITDPNQRFWKEYIDYTLGVWRDPYGSVRHAQSPPCSIGPDFTCGSATGGQFVQLSGPDSSATPDNNSKPFMNPTDNPKRPRHRFWFGPMTMIQYMSDTGLFPGTVHDISMYPAKIGIAGALTDIQTNHPNDLVSMILFSRPQFSNDPANTGAFNSVQYALSRSYSSMINSLWFPPNSSTADVRLWDPNGSLTPRAHADYNANTTTVYGFMLAYNQFSSSASMRTQLVGGQAVGGLGRKGAQRLVILETDGMANEDAIPVSGFTNSMSGTTNNSYYNILPGQTVNSSGFNLSNLLQVVQALCNKGDGTPGSSPGYTPNPAYPGFATAAKPVLIHTLAFGAIFEPSASGTEATNAVNLLRAISAIGGTVFPTSSSDPVNGYKWVIGTLTQRETNLRTAFEKVMDDGVAVVLVK